MGNSKDIRRPFYSCDHGSWVVPLTRGVISLIDECDLPKVTQNTWSASRHHRRWVAVHNLCKPQGKRVTQFMHRVIMSAPEDFQVDHKEHRSLEEKVIDNKRSHRNSASKFKGVTWDKSRKKWMAQIAPCGKTKHLGRFDSEVQAAISYNNAAEKYYGEYANLNEVQKL